MRFNGFTIIPDFGFFGDQLIPGNSIGPATQMDVVAGYARSFFEGLEGTYVQCEYVNTHRRPSYDKIARDMMATDNLPVIFLGCDWLENGARKRNISRVYYSSKHAAELANIISEGLEDWGHRYVYGHQNANPTYDPEMCKGNAIRISPFALNGPNSESYRCHLEELGQTLSVSISNWLNSKNMGKIRYG